MDANIEVLLQEAGFKYTKEYDPDEKVTYSLRFETAVGPVLLSVLANDFVFCPYVFTRDLDSISMTTPKRDFFQTLLRLNEKHWLARVSVWTAPETEVEWLLVSGRVPIENITPAAVNWVIRDTVVLAQEVLQAIALYGGGGQTSLPQGQSVEPTTRGLFQ
ncbi:MAG TPA: hypothetical protein VM389_09470 [Phycisphaerae bacterium]|nr:hypothetical protein [Phycisphaerae bacterium]